MLLAPRGSGKSTVCNVCFNIVDAIMDRDVNILIASRTIDQAKLFLHSIKENLLKPQIRVLFGDLKGTKWDETTASIAGRSGDNREFTFHIAGADGAVVSRHFDKIIGDDLVDEKNTQTEGKRDHLVRFFNKSLLPTLRPTGELRILGTRYHPEDLYDYLFTESAMFKKNYFILPAVFDKETGEPLDLDEQDDGTYVLPERAMTWDDCEEGFPSSELCLRRGSTSHGDFAAQYQNCSFPWHTEI